MARRIECPNCGSMNSPGDVCECVEQTWKRPNAETKYWVQCDSNNATGVEAAVCNDIAERQQKGIAKYHTTVADNPLPLRDWLQHAYEETLDKAIYLKRAIAEIDKTNPTPP